MLKADFHYVMYWFDLVKQKRERFNFSVAYTNIYYRNLSVKIRGRNSCKTFNLEPSTFNYLTFALCNT